MKSALRAVLAAQATPAMQAVLNSLTLSVGSNLKKQVPDSLDASLPSAVVLLVRASVEYQLCI